MGRVVFIGVFRCGKKPLVLPGEEKRAKLQKKAARRVPSRKELLGRIKYPSIMVEVWRPHYQGLGGLIMKGNNEVKSTAHSKYRCEYHTVFAPKYRRKEVYER